MPWAGVSFFPWWVVITQILNLFLLLLAARFGLEALSAFPKLYWNDACLPGRECARLRRKAFSADPRKARSSLYEEESWSPLIALPGRKNLELDRCWDFLSAQSGSSPGLSTSP